MFQRVLGISLSLLLSFGVFGAWLVFLQGSLSQEKSTANLSVIINEWSQGHGGSKEWVELFVTTQADLRGWDLGDSTPGDLAFSDAPAWSSVQAGTLIVIYNGNDPDTASLPPDDEDGADCRLVLGHTNGRFFTGNWPLFSNSNSSDNPHLRDANNATIHDFTVLPGGDWHPGSQASVGFVGSSTNSLDSQWQNQTAAEATPGEGNSPTNSEWVNGLCQSAATADLAVSKSGPIIASAGDTIIYDITVQNLGAEPATAVFLTDTLPIGLHYLADNSGFPRQNPAPQTLVWELGTLAQDDPPITFQLTATIGLTVQDTVVNEMTAMSNSNEANLANNTATATTIIDTAEDAQVVIDAIFYDGYEASDTDEAIALRNLGSTSVNLSQWSIHDGGSSTAILPETVSLQANETLWITHNGTAFKRQFGFAPDFETTDSDPTIANLTGTWPGFANSGDEVILLDANQRLVDVVVYGGGDTTQTGWAGTAVQPYSVPNVFATEGQILYRKRNQQTGQVVADTNMAQDWAQEPTDVINGRKVRYPGWDLDAFFQTVNVTETAVLTVAVAPDNAFDVLSQQIQAASQSIEIATLTFEHIALANDLVAALERGVAVTLLLEGAPVGGLDDHERYVCQQIEAAGGACWFMIRDDAQRIHDRYRFQHAKFMIIDGQKAAISSENFSPRSYPNDDKTDGTNGHRGVVLITTASTVVAHLQTLFAHDLDPATHQDLFRWQATHPTYGAPPAIFSPLTETGGSGYEVRYPSPLVINGSFPFEIVQSPESSLRDEDGLLGLVNQAGAGDTVLVQQLSERPFWGTSSSNPVDDPNPRLESYINAARRGAEVRLLLDSYFDTPSATNSNTATCDYIEEVAYQEQLNAACRVANPTGLGIHNKMVLVRISGQGFVHVGSINGSEQASKGNRELALQVQSNAAYALLADMFTRDWPFRIFLPSIRHQYLGPANHLLISEVLYNPSGSSDDAEFIELVNPTGRIINLSHYSIGDAVQRTDFEDVRRFPENTLLGPQETIVIATSATAFQAEYGFAPDFEILSTDSSVTSLIDDLAWGDPATFLQLANKGDEIILRNQQNIIVDIVTYGDSIYAATQPCLATTTSNRSLERFPYWRDSNNCQSDFRDWPFPNPKALP